MHDLGSGTAAHEATATYTRQGGEVEKVEMLHLTAKLNRPLSHMAMTSMKSVMLEEEGKSAGAETNIPAEVADKSKKNPPARLRILIF